MRIGFFVQYLGFSGTFFRWHNLAIGLTRLGHTVEVFAATYDKKARSHVRQIDGITYHVTAVYFPFQTFFGQWSHPYSYLKRYLKKYPELDVVHEFQPFGSGIGAWRKASAKARLRVYDWDDLWADGLIRDPDLYRYKHAALYEKRMPALADAVTTCSEFLKKRALNVGAKRCEVLYNGFWENYRINKMDARAKLGLQSDAFYIGFMGRTVDELEWCTDLLISYAAKVPNLRLALCGMPQELIPNVNGHNARIDHLGFLQPADVKYFSAALDFGLLPLHDNLFNRSRFPIKVADYLSTSTPIYASEVGEFVNISRHTGLIKGAGVTREHWVNNFAGVTNHRETEQHLPENFEHLKMLEWSTISKSLEDMYKRLIDER